MPDIHSEQDLRGLLSLGDAQSQLLPLERLSMPVPAPLGSQLLLSVHAFPQVSVAPAHNQLCEWLQ